MPTFLMLYILAGSAVVILAVLFGLDRVLDRAAWDSSERAGAVRIAACVLLGWFAIAVALAMAGTYQATIDGLPTIQFGIFIPIVIGVIALFRSRSVRRVLDAVPVQSLVFVQFYRVVGGIFLVLWLAGMMPGLFALPAGLGDIAVGLFAPFVARRYRNDPVGRKNSLVRWNYLGVLDLVIAITTGFLTSPSPFQMFAFNSPNTLIVEFPLILIPTFLVPISVMLHIVVFMKMAHGRFPATSFSPPHPSSS